MVTLGQLSLSSLREIEYGPRVKAGCIYLRHACDPMTGDIPQLRSGSESPIISTLFHHKVTNI